VENFNTLNQIFPVHLRCSIEFENLNFKPAKGRERMPSASSGGQVHGEQLISTPMPQKRCDAVCSLAAINLLMKTGNNLFAVGQTELNRSEPN